MRSSSSHRPVLAAVATASVAALAATAAAPAQAMPERFRDVGTIVWCTGEGGHLEAGDTTQGGAYWSAGILVDERYAVAIGEGGLLVDDRLEGTFPASDEESGDHVGDLTIDGTLSRGQTATVSGWDVDPDGRRYRSEGTRTPLSGSVTLSLGAVETTLECTGWDLELETFLLEREPAAHVSRQWWQDSYELDGNAGSVGFYGERRTGLGIALELYDPHVFAGERLQVRNGAVEGTLVLRDPDTQAIVGVARVEGTLTETGRELDIDVGAAYRWVTTLIHYDVSLTITTPDAVWSGTWPATYEMLRTRVTIPPRAL